MKKMVQTVAIFTAAVFCFCGCGKNSSTVSSENSATNYPLPDPPVVVNCEPGNLGGRFIISEIGDPKTFNFIMANESSSIDIGRFMFWSLLNFDVPTQGIKPGLAEAWTNSPDGKTWTFKLRKNLRWSDGSPLTADDVVFTWNDLIYNPAIPNSLRDQFIIGGKKFTVTKLDDETVQIVTPEVYAPFLQAAGCSVSIYPKHALMQYANSNFPSVYSVNWNPTDIVCNGPYRLKEYKQAEYT